jgi:hypothetical protein
MRPAASVMGSLGSGGSSTCSSTSSNSQYCLEMHAPATRESITAAMEMWNHGMPALCEVLSSL